MAVKKKTRRQVWKLPKYIPHAFRTKEESAKEYEQLAAYERRMAQDYTKAADSDPAAARHPSLRRQWRTLARKHKLRAEMAERAARRMRSLGSSRDYARTPTRLRRVRPVPPKAGRRAAPAGRLARRRDPTKVTNLATYREKIPRSAGQERAAAMSSEQRAYESREIAMFQNDLRKVEKLPLSERKENAREFAEMLHDNPALIAERIGWLLNGSYGYGSMVKAMQVARAPRMNQGAWLVQTAAALEWNVPPRLTAAAWHTLSAAQRSNLERLVKKEIKDALTE